MKTQLNSNKKTEVYSVSGFRDTLASPVFYPVIVVAIVLGVTSILGFVQNPLKLKSMVNVIHQKVATTNVVSGSIDSSIYKVSDQSANAQSFGSSYKSKALLSNTLSSKELPTFDLFTDIDAGAATSFEKMPVDKSIERIAFNYDVTSENFWRDLDSSKLETATEEMERKQREAGMFGAPLRINLQEKVPTDSKLNEKSIYALSASN